MDNVATLDLKAVTADFFKIEKEELKQNTSSLFDVYILVDNISRAPRNEDFLLYAKSPYKWSDRELTELDKLGINTLYIKNTQKKAYDRYLALQKTQLTFDQNCEPAIRIEKIQDFGAHLIEVAFHSDIDAPLMEKIDDIAGMVVNCLQEDPRTVRQIQSLADHSMYTYIHSIGVGILSTSIAWTLGERDELVLREFALGGMLHDIGKKFTPLRILNKAGPLTPEEWEEMKRHPSLGFEPMKNFNLPNRVYEIIAHHHEKLDGSGYPNALTGNNIPAHVQITTVADIFNALTTTRCYHFKKSKFEALMFMKHNLAGKVSKEVFESLVTCLITEK